jgi:hypothetical protein
MKQTSEGHGGLTNTLLRAWMWLVPIGMILASITFGAIAAADGAWGLLGMMAVFGLFGIGLAVLHYWVLYRFGKEPGQ